ncbi:PadR family transcriptional regulator [Microbacterium flavum]|uniref:PadR family transcriptional regulator n=1 Tax=Microbacterium flavum TaxID=415216 RepID=UPI0024ACE2DF|nr:PadR family transcriptional regulator [Microbacterium flavum]
MSNSYGNGFPGFGGQGFGFGGGDGKGGFGGQGFGGQGLGDIVDALGQFGQRFEKAFGEKFEQKAGSRMGRGDVRAAILALLAERPMHGYQLIQQIEERSGGAWKPSPGSVYPTLQLLTDEGAVEVEEDGGRKTYSLTEAGRAEADEKPAPWSHGGGDNGGEGAASGSPSGQAGAARSGAHGFGGGMAPLAKAGSTLAQAAMQVGRTGTPEQVDQAVAILDEARRKLYAILAEG